MPAPADRSVTYSEVDLDLGSGISCGPLTVGKELKEIGSESVRVTACVLRVRSFATASHQARNGPT